MDHITFLDKHCTSSKIFGSKIFGSNEAVLKQGKVVTFLQGRESVKLTGVNVIFYATYHGRKKTAGRCTVTIKHDFALIERG